VHRIVVHFARRAVGARELGELSQDVLVARGSVAVLESRRTLGCALFDERREVVKPVRESMSRLCWRSGKRP